MDELRAFFDLVDQADRAASARVARPTQPETPQRIERGGGARLRVARLRGRRRAHERPTIAGRRAARTGVAARFGHRGGAHDDGHRRQHEHRAAAAEHRPRKRGPGHPGRGPRRRRCYFGTRSNGPSNTIASGARSGARAAVSATRRGRAHAAQRRATHRDADATAASRGRPAAARRPPRRRAAAKPAPPDDVPPEPVPAARARWARRCGRAGRSRRAAGRAAYEQLVAEANRALENGNTAKAQKFVDEALRLQPSGVAAVTASAYLLLDKQQAAGRRRRVQARAQPFAQLPAGAVRPRRGLPISGRRRAGDRRLQEVPRRRARRARTRPPRAARFASSRASRRVPATPRPRPFPIRAARRRRCRPPAPPP